ncbi:DUF4082 domain-containing protein [Cellulomonas sp.]|uniref:DUF4082 domain-containing protein n=1 Tax=Cellulomonas sp. TaxID=40001 RepID=UPI003BA9817C
MSSRLAPRRLIALATAVAVGASLLVVAATPATAADPCGTGGNPVACENSKPGADPSEWEIDGAGDEGIQGFSTDISVNVGSTVGFKIKTTARAYTIDIYRTGYYGGLGARKIASVTPSATLPQSQPQCVTDATTEIYDCGNWALSASWAVPSTAVSGVYIARLHVPATDDESHITFIVRNDASTSAVVFQTSDPTWHAYNAYGGSNFYQGAANGRAYKLSYNRPFATRGGITQRDFYFGSEYPMVRFLERNGYDVSYIAGVDSDRRGALLKNHKVFLSVGHDEYWSGAQRANVEAARDAGVNLAFFSGNEVYWRTRYENSVAGASTAYRTLVSYKETWSNAKIDPSPQWTGTWRDPRLAATTAGAGRPENGLTGTLYKSNYSDLPVTVSAVEGKFRLWRGTSLASLATGATAALAPHTVGYESNEDIDNGARPPGLIRLSTTVGAVPEYLQDYGNTVTPGTTTHHTTTYRAPSGALVFSAGSIQWSWGLDETHDGDGAAADPRMQQATVNLLADMSAQPATLMSGLVVATKSTDTTAPTATITAPTAGAAIANGTSVTVTGTAADVGGRVAGVEVSTDGGTSWHPATGQTSWTYTYIQTGLGQTPVVARAIDDSANIGVGVTRTLGVACPCSIFGSQVPTVQDSDDPSGVELGLTFTATQSGYVTGVRFFKSAKNTGTHVGSLWSSTGQLLSQVTFSGESASGWQQALFPAAVPVTAGTSYVVSYNAPAGHYAVESDAFWSGGRLAPPLEVKGGFGQPSPGVFGWGGRVPDQRWGSSNYFVDVVFSDLNTSPLTLVARSPLPGSSSVPVGTAVSATFSRDFDAGTLTMTVRAGGVAVAGATAFQAATRVATFTPTAPLAAGTTYDVSVAATVGGAGITGGSTWSFRTAAPPQEPGATFASLYDETFVPDVVEAADTAAVTLGTRFRTTDPGVVTALRFYKGQGNGGAHVGALWEVGRAQPLATVTFSDESTQGWQSAQLSTPVRLVPGGEYIASYRTTVGRYSISLGGFGSEGFTRGPLVGISGQYSYGDGYPGAGSAWSYLADLVFKRDAAPLVVTAQSPAASEPGATTTTEVSVTLSTALRTGARLALSTADGPVAGTSSLSADGRKLRFTPAAALANGTTFTAVASGLESVDGAALADYSWTFTTVGDGGCPCTLFAGQTPAIAAVGNDDASVELGMAFAPRQDGQITAVRFYKGAGNSGTHTGTLWSSAGVALRTVTYTNETTTGWQTAYFGSPLDVTAGTTYVVSYLAPNGHYAATGHGFDQAVTTEQLTASAVGNGRYRYGGGFPTGTWEQTNYFVDVVFAPAPPRAAAVSATTPAAGATRVPLAATVSATLTRVPDAGAPVLTLTTPGGPVAGTTTWDASARTITFRPSAALPPATVVSAVVAVAGQPLDGGSWSFTTVAPSVTVSFWSDSDIPAVDAWDDPGPLQVGTRFTTSAAGSVTAIRFFKGASNTGTHVVKLWGPDRRLLSEAPSLGESASGWQTVLLPEPIELTPGQAYTVAYQSSGGRYAVDPGALAAPRTVGPLTTIEGAYVYGNGSDFPAGGSSASYGVDLVFVTTG